ncbi:MAG: SDR family oxidoreductase [Patescibacteria group bacterium]
MSKELDKKVVLITGSSSGIGFLSVLKFARQGFTTYASTRNLDSDVIKELNSIAKKENLSIKPIHINLLNHNSVESAIEKIIKEDERIDILINNAGYGYFSAVEDINSEEYLKQFKTNVTGVIKTIQEVLPHMRSKGKGLIVNVSSIMGFSTAPLNAPYSSSKYALECISETLAFEVKPFGIDVVIVEPGNFHTKFIQNAHFQEHSEDSPYQKLYRRHTTKDASGRDPKLIADLFLKISNTKNPKLRYMVGNEVFIRKLLHTLLIDNLWIRFLRLFYKW